MRPFNIIAFLLLCTSAAGLVKKEEVCASACNQIITGLNFNETSLAPGFYGKQCTGELLIKSLYLCLRNYCSPVEINTGLRLFNETCVARASLSLPPFDIIADITGEQYGELHAVDLPELNNGYLIEGMVAVSDTLFDLGYKTIHTWEFVYSTHIIYSHAMYYFWVIVVSIGLGGRLLSYLTTLYKSKSQSYGENFNVTTNTMKNWLPNGVGLWTRRNIIMPPTFHSHSRISSTWYTIPPRVQSLTIAGFIIINAVLCCVHYHLFANNLYWSSIMLQFYRYSADRTGIISIANVPILWLFASRNNVLLWVTGWSFGTYNSFHRWVARVSTVEAILHSVAYTLYAYTADSWDAFYQQWLVEWWYTGVIATVVMVLICLLSFYNIRLYYYELFLYSHIVLSVIFLITLWYHLKVMDGAYNSYIWWCLGIWILDRLLRYARILLLNSQFWKGTAIGTYSAESDLIRLDVSVSSHLLKPVAGSFYYIYVFNGLRFWENHPFTLSTFTILEPSSDIEFTATKDPTEESAPLISDSETSSTHGHTSLTNVNANISFLIRPYDGFTRHLRNKITQSPRSDLSNKHKANLQVLVEGPYGSPLPLHQFDHLLFFVGGTGVTVALSHIASLNLDATRRKSDQTIHVIWAVRQREFLDDILRKELKSVADGTCWSTTLDAYVTRNHTLSSSDMDVQESESGHDADPRGNARNVHIHQGRPDIHNIIMDEILQLRESNGGRMAVVACGPKLMVVEARYGLMAAMDSEKSAKDVEFFEESFAW